MANRKGFTRADLASLKQLIGRSAPDTAWEVLLNAADEIATGAPLEAIIDDEHDALGHAIAGVILRYQALNARGARVADHTSNRQFQSYFDLLEQAEDLLSKAVQLSPTSGLAVGGLASFALERDEKGKAECEALLRQAPDAPATAYCDVLQAWSYKWGGSQDEMWRCLNRLWVDDDPRCWAMVARATFEERLFRDFFSNEHQHYVAGFGARRGPLSLNEASEAALARPDDPSNPGLTRFVHGWFGRVFWDSRDFKRARPHLSRTRSHMNKTIWVYGTVLMSARQRFGWAKVQSGVF